MRRLQAGLKNGSRWGEHDGRQVWETLEQWKRRRTETGIKGNCWWAQTPAELPAACSAVLGATWQPESA